MSKTVVRLAFLSLFSIAVGATPPALAASVPHTFTAGGVASADEVNANFAALVAAVTALEAKVGPHTTATLAGTYDYFEVKIDIDSLSANSKSMAGSATTGTVVLNANGTGQANLSTSYRQLTFNAVVTGDNTVQLGFFNSPDSFNDPFTWSLANGTVTVSEGGSFVVVGQLLIQSIQNSERQNGMVILARRN